MRDNGQLVVTPLLRGAVGVGPQKVMLIVGARPNFMKMGPVMAALKRRPESFAPLLVHTGQHYDAAMSKVFLEELGIGEPDYSLGVGQAGSAQPDAADHGAPAAGARGRAART